MKTSQVNIFLNISLISELMLDYFKVSSFVEEGQLLFM